MKKNRMNQALGATIIDTPTAHFYFENFPPNWLLHSDLVLGGFDKQIFLDRYFIHSNSNRSPTVKKHDWFLRIYEYRVADK